IGPKLAGMLRQAGVLGVQVNVVQPTHLEGEGKLIASVTMERIAGSVVSEGLATEKEVKEVVNGLNEAAADTAILMSLPPEFQTWGRRAEQSAGRPRGTLMRPPVVKSTSLR